MAIKEFITLEGVEDERDLKKLAKTGEQALGQFRKLGQPAADVRFRG